MFVSRSVGNKTSSSFTVSQASDFYFREDSAASHFKASVRKEVSESGNVLRSSAQCHQRLRGRRRLSAAQQQRGSTRTCLPPGARRPASSPRPHPAPSPTPAADKAPRTRPSEEPRSHCPTGPSPHTVTGRRRRRRRLTARLRSLSAETSNLHPPRRSAPQPLPAGTTTRANPP